MKLEFDKKLGFGCMRFKDKSKFSYISNMFDKFIDAGYTYFDTARVYLEGTSEKIIKKCLTSRFDRDKYILADKLSSSCFKNEDEIDDLFLNQLKDTGVEYFDFYLMHAQEKSTYKKYMKTNAYSHALEFKKQGRIKHFGISFHDTPAMLTKILNKWPQIEFVQIQLNYLDMYDNAINSAKLLKICKDYKKPVIVMEPTKGGSLTNLPDDYKSLIEKKGQTLANLAFRYAANQKGVFMVLSGMNDINQVKENIKTFNNLSLLDDDEITSVKNIVDKLNNAGQIKCTGCRYCVDGCPKHINIPEIFSCFNKKKMFNNWNQNFYYGVVHTSRGRRAKDCIKCGRCEKSCPQHLKIRHHLQQCSEIFDKDLGKH